MRGLEGLKHKQEELRGQPHKTFQSTHDDCCRVRLLHSHKETLERTQAPLLLPNPAAKVLLEIFDSMVQLECIHSDLFCYGHNFNDLQCGVIRNCTIDSPNSINSNTHTFISQEITVQM